MLEVESRKGSFDEIVKLGQKKLKEYREKGLLIEDYNFDEAEIDIGPELPNNIINAIRLIDQCLKKTPIGEIPEELLVARALLEEAEEELGVALYEALWYEEDEEEDLEEEE